MFYSVNKFYRCLCRNKDHFAEANLVLYTKNGKVCEIRTRLVYSRAPDLFLDSKWKQQILAVELFVSSSWNVPSIFLPTTSNVSFEFNVPAVSPPSHCSLTITLKWWRDYRHIKLLSTLSQGNGRSSSASYLCYVKVLSGTTKRYG